MNPSASLCRSQEAFHRDRAAAAQLENVRVVATRAATAWGREALAAERREARHRRTKVIAAILALGKREARELPGTQVE
jgi:hypothetical protein